MITRALMGIAVAAALAIGTLAPGTPVTACGDGSCEPPPPEPQVKCNSGRGNGDEGCDPGKGNQPREHNQGGDEVTTP